VKQLFLIALHFNQKIKLWLFKLNLLSALISYKLSQLTQHNGINEIFGLMILQIFIYRFLLLLNKIDFFWSTLRHPVLDHFRSRDFGTETFIIAGISIRLMKPLKFSIGLSVSHTNFNFHYFSL
jgi:hypothetical protein